MKTTDFLAEIIRRHKLTDRYGNTGTQYSLWKHMHEKYGWSHATVSNYYNGKGFPGEEQCLQIAAELGIDPAYVLICIEAERTKNNSVKKALESAAKQLRMAARTAAAGVILSLSVLTAVGVQTDVLQEKSGSYVQINHPGQSEKNRPLYIMLNGLLLLLAGLLAWCAAHPFVRGISPHSADNNLKKSGATDGPGSANSAPACAAHPTPGGTAVRRIPAHVQAVRSRRPATGGGADVVEIKSRVSGRLAGLSDTRWRADSAGRRAGTSKRIGEFSLSAGTAGADRARPATANRHLKGAAAGQSIADVSRAVEDRRARADGDDIRFPRSVHPAAAHRPPSAPTSLAGPAVR
jgi:transcriptional regulator with XRE-family HTH domain